MIHLSLEIKYFMALDKDEKVNVAKYLAQHRDVFEILQCMDNSALSITYYWAGDKGQRLRIFISISTCDEKDAYQFMSYFKRHFPHIALDFSLNKESELKQAITSFPKVVRMIAKKGGAKSNSKLQSIDDMSDKLSHWNESWLLNITLKPIVVATTQLVFICSR